MKKSTSLFAVLALAFSAWAAPVESNKAEILAKIGKETSAELIKTLGGQLKKAMAEGGPAKAVDFCSQHAWPLTEKVAHGAGEGVRVKRVTDKPRNPANAADPVDALALAAFADQKTPYLTKITEGGKTVYRYYQPMRIPEKAPCLKCHGEVIHPQAAMLLSERYPEDKAYGYKTGDLRGAVRVEVDASVLSPR